ncbi:MAG: methionine synthase (B12-independent) [Armatimonadetes bacterium]|jgi:5-methyltetrahydropteroyltriglutamate--homocysteine methyltransferase|nr:methionine synthase (B12-independent) [Armatimonadota bacterium]
MTPLPLLATSTIGSYAPPSWFCSAVEAIERGEFGPSDRDETYNDATRIAIRDQEEAGIDLVTEGEMRRVDFNLGFYGRLKGLQELPPARTKGPDGHDMRGRWQVVERISAPDGLGIVEEFEFAKQHTDRPIKVTCPGPYTLAGRPQGGSVYADRYAVAKDMADLISEELRKCVAAGATYIQLDEPSAAVYPDNPMAFVELVARAVQGVDAKIGMHMCFGNFRGRAVGKRAYAPLFPHILECPIDQFVLEFASREMAEIDLWKRFPNDKELAIGVIDVKNYYIETPEDVAERIRAALKYVEPEKLTIVPDCGFSQTARWATYQKLVNMVKGAAIVRQELEERK